MVMEMMPYLPFSETDRQQETDSSGRSSVSDTQRSSLDYFDQALKRIGKTDASLHHFDDNVVQKWSKGESLHTTTTTLELQKTSDAAAEADLLDLESGQASEEHEDEEEGKCRVCHMIFGAESGTREAMQLGCNCKDDLSIAHRDCAETWFKIKGNRTCEICGVTVQNISGNEEAGTIDQWNDSNANTQGETQARSWQSLSLCNFFLACMVVTFILLWLFRVTIS